MYFQDDPVFTVVSYNPRSSLPQITKTDMQ